MTDLKITKDNNNICVYERLNDDCIRLLHMYGKNPVCVVPDMLDGMRVTEKDLSAGGGEVLIIRIWGLN